MQLIKSSALIVFVLALSTGVAAQDRPAGAAAPPQTPAQEIEVVSAVTTSHTATIKGQRIPYAVTAGTYPVFDAGGRIVASLFHVFYKRTDIKDTSTRPLLISFNGGPGSASVWMHIGYTGPKFLEVDDEGFPIQPYGVRENPHSVLARRQSGAKVEPLKFVRR